MPPSPIAQLLRAAPAAVTISTVTDATAADYDPASSARFTPGAPVTADIMAVPQKLTEEMLAKGYKAHLLVGLDLPSTVVPGKTQVLYASVTYTIEEVRRRVYRGVHDGWSLECSA